MKERGKAVETYDKDMEYYSTAEMPCRKHPSSSSVGICAFCLKDRLVRLVCSDCGEQRLSSCSCSEISSNRNSCTVEVGSVGRVSFLIENEKTEAPQPSSKPKIHEKTEDVMVLRRSSSSCVETEVKRNGFWKFGKLFRKKKEKDCGNKSVGGFDEKSEMWVVDHMGVSRSRSLCSFRNGGWFGSEDGGDLMVSGARSSISGARSSNVTACMVLDSGRRSGFSEAEPRRSGFGFSDSEPRRSNFGFSDSEPRKSGFGFSDSEPRRSGFGFSDSEQRKSSFGFSEVEPRKSGEKKDEGLISESSFDYRGVRKIGLVEVNNNGVNGGTRRVFSLRESDFSGMDESGFIDLKLDYSAESKPELSSESAFGSMRGSSEYSRAKECGASYGGLMADGIFNRGGSCRITVNDRGLKKGRRSMKGWRWIFRHHPSWGSSGKKDEDLMFKT